MNTVFTCASPSCAAQTTVHIPAALGSIMSALSARGWVLQQRGDERPLPFCPRCVD